MTPFDIIAYAGAILIASIILSLAGMIVAVAIAETKKRLK